MTHRAYGALFACLILLIGSNHPTAANAESIIRARLNSDIRSTDPGTQRDDNTDTVLMHIVEGLIAFREDTSVGPLLAQSYDVSSDGRTYTFTLRGDATFHSGAKLTADDVIWSWNRFLDPATRWFCLSEFDGTGAAKTKIASITKLDASTVAFHLQEPSALFLVNMARSECGGAAILHRDSIGPDGSWRAPIGTGPFRLREWKPGQYIDLAKFEGYVTRTGPRDGNTGGKYAQVDRIRFLVIPDSSAAKAAILSGAIDVLSNVPPPDLAELKGRPEVALDETPTMQSFVILLQSNDPLLRDPRIRRALATAIDTKAVANAVTQGTAQPNNAAIPVSSPFHSKLQSAGFVFDPAAARKLLAEAGYAGQAIKMITNRQYPEMMDAAVLVQAMLRTVGVKIDIEVLDWATEVSRFQRGEYQMMSFAYSARLDPSLSLDQIMGPKSVQPRKVWDDPIPQSILAESMATLDRDKRQMLFDRLHELMLRDAPIIYLYNPTNITAVSMNVVGYKGWPAVLPRFWGVTKRQ